MSDDTVTSFREGHAACPFVAFEDDRDHRAETPDYRHRCFASLDPEPRALPHQERFCLSAAFAACPIFLDWARAEAAGVLNKTAAAASAEQPVGAATRVTTETPAFLASSARTTPAESTPRAAHSADPGSGLWGFEGAPKRTIAPLLPPAKVSSSDKPVVSMARRQPTRPDWENAPRLDNFPRLRAREDRSNNQPLLLAALAITALMVTLIVWPLISGNNGGGSRPSSSASVLASGETPTPLDTPTPTPVAQPTFQIHIVQPGETISSIAAKFGIVPDLLLAANPLVTNPNKIIVGQKLFIPWQTWIPPTPIPSVTPTPVPTPTPKPTPTPTGTLGY